MSAVEQWEAERAFLIHLLPPTGILLLPRVPRCWHSVVPPAQAQAGRLAHQFHAREQ
jgi:hypothetical protein